jgi:hypothetical protein
LSGTADGTIWLSTRTATVGLVVKEGRVVDGPPYAYRCGYVRRDARQLWRDLHGRPGYRLAWLPDEPIETVSPPA